jgi:hypothetical protein
MPGYGGAPFSMLAALAAEPGLQELGQRSKLRVPVAVDLLEPRAIARLEARYALQGCVTAAAVADGGGGTSGASPAGGGGPASAGRWLIEGHDEVADTLGLLALEVDQAAARHKEPTDKVRASVRKG